MQPACDKRGTGAHVVGRRLQTWTPRQRPCNGWQPFWDCVCGKCQYLCCIVSNEVFYFSDLGRTRLCQYAIWVQNDFLIFRFYIVKIRLPRTRYIFIGDCQPIMWGPETPEGVSIRAHNTLQKRVLERFKAISGLCRGAGG